jgi:hypothetical protein
MSESSVFEKRIDTPSGAAEVTAGDPSAIGTPAFTVLSALVDVAVLLVTLGIFLGDEAWLKAGGWVTLGFTAVGGLFLHGLTTATGGREMPLGRPVLR